MRPTTEDGDLTLYGLVMQNWAVFGLNNGLVPNWCQAFIWTTAALPDQYVQEFYEQKFCNILDVFIQLNAIIFVG